VYKVVQKSRRFSDVLNSEREVTSAPPCVLCVCVEQIPGAVTGIWNIITYWRNLSSFELAEISRDLVFPAYHDTREWPSQQDILFYRICFNIILPIYRGVDKTLARPGKKQARKHVKDARDFNNIETQFVIKFFFPARQGAEGNSPHSDRNISLFPSWSG